MKNSTVRLMVCIVMLHMSLYAMDQSKLSALTKSRICAYLLAHTQKVKTDKNEAERRPIPLLIQEMIIDYMDTDWNSFPKEMNNWLFQEKKLYDDVADFACVPDSNILLIKQYDASKPLRYMVSQCDQQDNMRTIGDSLSNVMNAILSPQRGYLWVAYSASQSCVYAVKNRMKPVGDMQSCMVTQAIFSYDDTYLWCQREPQDRTSGSQMYSISQNMKPIGPVLAPVQSGAFWPNDQYLWVNVSATFRDLHANLRHLYDVQNNMQLIGDDFYNINVSQNGRYLFGYQKHDSNPRRYKGQVYDINNGMAKIGSSIDTIDDVTLSADGHYILIGDSDAHKWQLYDVYDGMKPIGDRIDEVIHATFSDDNRYVCIQAADQTWQLYDVRNGMTAIESGINKNFNSVASVGPYFFGYDASNQQGYLYDAHNNVNHLVIDNMNHIGEVKSVKLSVDNRYLFVQECYNNGQLADGQLYDMHHNMQEKHEQLRLVREVRLSPNGRYAFITENNFRGTLYEITNNHGPVPNKVDHHNLYANDNYVFIGHARSNRGHCYPIKRIGACMTRIPLRQWDGGNAKFSADSAFLYYIADKTLYRRVSDKHQLLHNVGVNGLKLIKRIYNDAIASQVSADHNVLTLDEKDVATYDALPNNVRILLGSYVKKQRKDNTGVN